jgi:hypothetical protein
VTFTFNPAKVDSFDYSDCTKKLSDWIDNIKKRKCSNMAYIGVPELHESGRYHFHFLMANIDELEFIDSEKRTKQGDIIYNIGNYNLGWTTATKIKNTVKASRYITKYITEDLVQLTKNKKRYWNSKNLKLPEVKTYLFSDEQKEDLKIVIKEKITFTKVVVVNTPQYSNEIEYISVKQ